MQNIVMKNKLPLFIILIAIFASCSSKKPLTNNSKDYLKFIKEEPETKKDLSYKTKKYSHSPIVVVYQKEPVDNSIDYSKFTKEELETKKEKIEIDLNHDIAVKYIKYAEEENKVPPIGYYGFSKIKKYRDSNIDLQDIRKIYEDSSQKLKDFINEKDNRKKIAYEKYKREEISLDDYLKIKSEVYRNLELKYPKEYCDLRRDRTNKLGISNRKTMEFIIADYHSKNKLFPVNWIPEKDLTPIKKDSYINKRIVEIDKIETELINRI